MKKEGKPAESTPKPPRKKPHTAYGLFKKNMASVNDTLSLYRGIRELRVGLDTGWLLRGSIVFLVSALDTYFHDRIKYGISRATRRGMPEALLGHRITIGDLEDWEASRRKGNVIRNWIGEHLASIPLQSPDRIALYMRYIGVEQLWNKVEPDNKKRQKLLDQLNILIKRRNQIAHEGDRLSGRGTGKRLRDISESQVNEWVSFVEELIKRINERTA